MLTRFFSNGWNRAWIVLITLQAIGGAVRVALFMMPTLEWDGDFARTYALLWAVSSILEFGILHAIAWTIRGFRGTRMK